MDSSPRYTYIRVRASSSVYTRITKAKRAAIAISRGRARIATVTDKVGRELDDGCFNAPSRRLTPTLIETRFRGGNLTGKLLRIYPLSAWHLCRLSLCPSVAAFGGPWRGITPITPDNARAAARTRCEEITISEDRFSLLTVSLVAARASVIGHFRCDFSFSSPCMYNTQARRSIQIWFVLI